MVIKVNNNVEDVEVFLEYNCLNSIWWKTYYMVLSIIGILAPITVFIYTIKSDLEFYLNIFRLSFHILMTIGFTIFAVYLFLKLTPKLIMKRLKTLACKYYKNKRIFSTEKAIVLKNECIEVIYNTNNKFKIQLSKNILVDQFKGYIIISFAFANNKISKVYPLIIPANIFESEKNKEEFIKNIEEKKMLL